MGYKLAEAAEAVPRPAAAERPTQPVQAAAGPTDARWLHPLQCPLLQWPFPHITP